MISPPVISGTPALRTLQAHGEVRLHTSRPETQEEIDRLCQQCGVIA
jgi:hypothetical protein